MSYPVHFFNSKTMYEKDFLTIKECAAYLGATKQFLYQQIKKHDLTMYKVGRRAYLRHEDLLKLFQPKNAA